LRRLFHDRYRRDLVAAFKRLQDAGALEIITCGATHGFLPLMVHQEAIRAQVQVACMHYRMHFGRDPRGIWLPECGYAPGMEPYDPAAARERAETHAGNFLFNRAKQLEFLRASFREGPPPIVISPYDAELYGHWWYEGPIFLDHLIRKAAANQDALRLQSPIDYLAENPEQQLAQPPMSSWSAGGYAGVWLDEGNDWIYRYLHKASERMIEMARAHHDARRVTRRALNQAARELLLAQSSDWAFIIKTGTMVDYAVRRTREHLLRFSRLYEQVKANGIDEGWLSNVESRDNLFPEIDYRVYRPA